MVDPNHPNSSYTPEPPNKNIKPRWMPLQVVPLQFSHWKFRQIDMPPTAKHHSLQETTGTLPTPIRKHIISCTIVHLLHRQHLVTSHSHRFQKNGGTSGKARESRDLCWDSALYLESASNLQLSNSVLWFALSLACVNFWTFSHIRRGTNEPAATYVNLNIRTASI